MENPIAIKNQILETRFPGEKPVDLIDKYIDLENVTVTGTRYKKPNLLGLIGLVVVGLFLLKKI